jgi:predicted transcriptional regulator
MEEQNRTISWLSINSQLMSCLKTKTNHKFSRYDAFIWLIEKIKNSSNKSCEQDVLENRSGFTASYMRLAEEWKWTRQTVQKFIEELVELSIISIKRQGNAFVFSLHSDAEKTLLL